MPNFLSCEKSTSGAASAVATRPTNSLFAALAEGTGAELSLAAHYVKNVYALAFPPIENPTGGLNNLPITPALELGRLRAAVWMNRKLIDMIEYSLYQAARRGGIVKGNVVSDGVEIV
jgi:hypothetical protein